LRCRNNNCWAYTQPPVAEENRIDLNLIKLPCELDLKSMEDVFSLLSEPVREMASELGIRRPTEPQRLAIPLVLEGSNVLLLAPTGSGKTEAVMLPILSKLSSERPGSGICLLYITPLRALNRDMVRRFSTWCSKLSLSVGVRHGDTPQRERKRQSENPPHILITTPETFQTVIVNARMKDFLKNIRWVVVDEVHQLVESRRGVQLSVGLERLARVTGKEFQRIGISATVGDPKMVGKLIAGEGREIKVLECSTPKGYSYWVEWPTPTQEDFERASVLFTSPEASARISRINELAEFHNATLVFVNSRQVAEMLTLKLSSLNKGFGIHHSSLSREERERIELEFKNGKLKAIVCTSTLELGIDIGSADLVVQYLSPRQVTSLIQRVGRSGHKLDLFSKGIIISGYADDALESIASISLAERGEIEAPVVHKGALDVLAHQLVGMAIDSQEGLELNDALSIFRRSLAYEGLDGEELMGVVSYLERLRLIERREGKVFPTRKGRLHYLKNVSMIPDERRYLVWDISSESPIGSVGDEFIETKAKVGLNFICGGAIWRIESITSDGRVLVLPVEDPTAALPGWDGEMPPVSSKLAVEVGRMRGEIAEMLRRLSADAVVESLSRSRPADRYAVERIVEYVKAQIDYGAPVPTDRLILVEVFENYLIINSCFGERVNRGIGVMLERRLYKTGLVRNWWCDGYRVLFELATYAKDSDVEKSVREVLMLPTGELVNELKEAVEERFPMGYYMKHVAERFGVIERGLFLSEEYLSSLVRNFKGTPIYKETLRQVMVEKIDCEGITRLNSKVRSGEVELVFLRTEGRPTPISSPILYKFTELPELIHLDPTNTNVLERTRKAILESMVNMLCLECGTVRGQMKVGDLPERPRCEVCGSGLLAPIKGYVPRLAEIVRKRLANEALDETEVGELSRARRAADVILSYGRKGAMALSVYGVGPQTASKILSKMQYDESELIRDLIQAKLKYVQTRRFWD